MSSALATIADPALAAVPLHAVLPTATATATASAKLVYAHAHPHPHAVGGTEVAAVVAPADDPLHVVFVGGTVAGIAQVLVGHPFDSVKVMVQTQSAAATASPLQVLRRTVAAEGVRGLFKGVTSPMSGVGFCNAVLFTTQATFNSAIAPDSTSPAKYAATGALSGLAISLLACPMELLKVRVQAQATSGAGKHYAGVWDCLVKTVRAEGVQRGLYRGWTITALRDVPSFAAYFATYEILRQHDVAPFLAGGLAGIACWLPCYPQDVLKSRVQSTAALGRGPLPAHLRPWTMAAAYVRANVARALWRGLSPTLLRAFPANAATFAVYEVYRAQFGGNGSTIDE
ncbi:hypothetical protein H9P43_009916 [Blastocladiella emersonii ATCC 22665]|nr:hypothetical protein H9P43_009916 [Blastocladiella emersonii ATCC 22665]